MNALEAIVLGVVQGLTEFLPISSSGHLILVPWLGDIRYLQDHPDFNKTFDVALHLGTLIGVVAYFRVEVRMMVEGGVGARAPPSRRDRVWPSRPAHRHRHRPGGDRRRAGRGLDRRPPRGAVADRDLPRRLRPVARLRRPAARAARDRVALDARRPEGGARAGARARARGLALRDHDHGRALAGPHPRRGRPLRLLPPHSRDGGRHRVQGRRAWPWMASRPARPGR